MTAGMAPSRSHRMLPALARACLVAALLATVGVAAAPAQQPADQAPPARADTSAMPQSAAGPVGPRRDSGWQPFRPNLFARDGAAGAFQEGRMHTIRLSTLALVLIGVVLLLLIVR